MLTNAEGLIRVRAAPAVVVVMAEQYRQNVLASRVTASASDRNVRVPRAGRAHKGNERSDDEASVPE
jgi:hypothetical protein